MSSILVAIEHRDLLDLDILHRSRTHRPGGGTPRSRIRNVYPLYGPIPATRFRGRYRRATMDELLQDSDVVSVHVPVNAERFRTMTGSIGLC